MGGDVAFRPFRWAYLDADGAPRGSSEDFTTRPDAEEWLGDRWRDLLGDGVLEVELLSGDEVLYRMGLSPADGGGDA